MKYLKEWILFENIAIPHNNYILEKYLDELDITPDKLNDIFRDMLDLEYKSYLQLFYIDKNGDRWNTLPVGEKRTSLEPLQPYLSISFSNEFEESSRNIKRYYSDRSDRIVYYKETDILESFTNSILMLKSILPEMEIYWRFEPKNCEVCIYFEKVLNEE